MARYKIVPAVLALIFLIASCGKKDIPLNPPGPEPPNSPDPPVTIVQGKKAQIDSIRAALKANSFNKEVLRDSVWEDSSGVSFFIRYSADYYRVNDGNEAEIYPGAFLNKKDFQEAVLTPFNGYPDHPVALSSTAGGIAGDTLIAPNRTAFTGLMDHWFKGLQNGDVSLSSGRVPFKRYSTALFNFPGWIIGENSAFEQIDPAYLVPRLPDGTDAIAKRSGYVVYSMGVYHHVLFNDARDYNEHKASYAGLLKNDACFISDLVYGYAAYVFLESDATEERLKSAVNSYFNNWATADDIAVLKSADARVYYQHVNRNSIAARDLNGYERLIEFKKLFEQPFNYKGVPLVYRVKGIRTEGSSVSLYPVQSDRVYKTAFRLK
ncbi:hypothetical protein [Niabella drilacis]|nr:hypothetical protein [Niabella drilacis]